MSTRGTGTTRISVRMEDGRKTEPQRYDQNTPNTKRVTTSSCKTGGRFTLHLRHTLPQMEQWYFLFHTGHQ